MRYIVFIFMILLLNACGWKMQCTKVLNYELNQEYSVNVGLPIVQSGCFEFREDPFGLNKVVGKKSHLHPDEPIKIVSELIYSGLENSTIHIAYREYTYDGLARAPFFQSLYYDISKSKEIVFKNLTIQVIDVDNSRIKYKVIKEPPRPVAPPPINVN